MIIFNVTNISYNLLCSHKKVDPPKNVALGPLSKLVRIKVEENGGSNEAIAV